MLGRQTRLLATTYRLHRQQAALARGVHRVGPSIARTRSTQTASILAGQERRTRTRVEKDTSRAGGRAAYMATSSASQDAIAKARDERRWNRMADNMSRFHEYFKQEYNVVYELADGSFSDRGMNLRMYLSLADELRKHLTAHHTIEERHIFPHLAKRMPSFKEDEQHIKSHHGIHEGLDKLGTLIDKWRDEPSTYSPQEMRECLDSWRDVLFNHLDEEVQDLSGENMRKYWSPEEFERLMLIF